MVNNMWALIINGKVREITDIDPEGRFHPDLEWIPCDDSVKEHMLYSEGEFSEAPTDE